jgi:hypothetical protein
MIRKSHWSFTTAIALTLACVTLAVSVSELAGAEEDRKPEFQKMAPVEQYRMSNQAEEIAMARSAAPASISADAEVMVLGSHGYETVIKGKNGFACLVLRSWAASFGDAEFWNARARSPICYNAAAVGSVLAVDLEKTRWVLAGLSETEMRAKSKSSRAAHQAPAPAAMAYMMSKQQHLSDADGHWHPHIMVYQPHTEAASWGANLGGSPVVGFDGPSDQATTFAIPVYKWSDGSSAAEMHQ